MPCRRRDGPAAGRPDPVELGDALSEGSGCECQPLVSIAVERAHDDRPPGASEGIDPHRPGDRVNPRLAGYAVQEQGRTPDAECELDAVALVRHQGRTEVGRRLDAVADDGPAAAGDERVVVAHASIP